MKNQISSKNSSFLKIILCFIFILFVFYPFIQMILKIEAEDIKNVFNTPLFIPALKNSLKISCITTFISVNLGLALALSLQRTQIKCKSLLAILLTLPMLVPSISHGMSLTVLFGTNGIISKLLNLEGTIYGFFGIIIGSVLYSYPVAFLMFNDVLKYQDSTPYEAATILGIPKSNITLNITMPYLKKPLIATIFSVFTMVITDYGVPLMIGGKTTTLAVIMYQEVLGQLEFGKGSVIGLLLLIPAIITFIFNTVLKKQSNSNHTTKTFQLKKNRKRDSLAYFICTAIIFIIILLVLAFAIVAFTVKYPGNMTPTFNNIVKMFTLRGDAYLLNSIIIAFCVATLGSGMAFTTAYLTARIPSKLSHTLHLFSITTLAIPGLVLGLSYAMTFNSTFIYGTIAILILVNTMHFFASPYQMMYNSLNKINENIENVGKTLGINKTRIIFNIIIPQCKSTFIEMFSYFFVNSMMTISAVSFLANASTKPISLMIGQFEAQMLYECAAVISLIILFSNFIIKSIASYANNKKTQLKDV